MPVPTSSIPMGGALEIDINGTTIPAFMLGEISANVAQVLRESERLSGTTSTPSNVLDNPSFDVTFFPNTWSDLQYFMPGNYDGTSGSDTGAWTIGGGSCSLPTPVPVVFHYVCATDKKQDISFTGNVSFEDNGARNASDDLSVTIHLYPTGEIVYGTPTAP